MKKLIIALFLFFVLCGSGQAAQQLSDGIKYINAQNYKRACEFFKNYTDNKPNDPDGHYWLGLCYKHLGQNELSTYHLQKSYELSSAIDNVDFKDIKPSDNEEDYIDIGLMYLESKNYDTAHIYADMALKLNPENANGYYLRARIFDEQNDIQNAKSSVIRAIQANNDLLASDLAKKYEIKEVPPFDFEYYNAQGVQYYYRGDLEQAKNCFKKSLSMNFKNPSALNNLAKVYIKTQNLTEAKSTLKKAQMFAPRYYQTYVNLSEIAKLNSSKENISAFARRKYQNEQKNYLKKAIDINPNDKRAYVDLGNCFIEQNDYSEAIKNFQTALVLDDEYFEAYIGLAACYIKLNDSKKAFMALRSAGALNQKTDEVAFYLAKMCILDNRFDEAKNYLIEASNKSDNPEYFLELGKIYYYKDDFQSAKNAFLKAQSLDIRFNQAAELYNYLGLCYYRMNDLDNAITNMKKALDLAPDKVIYAYNLALAYKSCQNNDLYTKTYKNVLSFVPKEPEDYVDLSTVYFDTGSQENALKILDTGIKKYPRERILYNAKLKLLQTTKNDEGAEEVKRTIKLLFN